MTATHHRSAHVSIVNAEPVSAKTAPVRIRTLGACLITVGRTRIKPDAAVLFALALYLGLRAGESGTRSDVLELLWPDTQEAARRHALRQLLYRLKRAGLPVDGDGHELSIDPAAVDCDLAGLMAEQWITDVSLSNLPSPRTVLPGYQPAVSAPFHEWVDGIRMRAATQIKHAAMRHISAARLQGRWADLDRVARICLETDPLHEEATLALAEATAMSGSKAEALRILDAYLWELGEKDKTIALPARLLRRRISDQPVYHAPRAGDPPLIAREDDIAWLNTRIDVTRAGGISTALLVGPPGIGKTAVVRTFVSHAEMRGWRFVESRLQPSDVDRPMSVFGELLPPLLKAAGALGAAPESIAQLRQLIEHDVVDDILANKSQEAEAVQARIRTSMLDLLGAVTHEGPLVLVLEDLHWIDKQSLRLLPWLLDYATEVPVLWLMTARLEGRFADLREALPLEQVPQRTVGPLDRSAAMELFRACVPEKHNAQERPLPEHAYDVTGGNPMFIREVAGHWAETGGNEGLPGNLKAIMRGRMGRLPAAAQRLLHCSAVLGRFATVPRVSTLLDVGTSELLTCIDDVEGLGLLGLGGELGSLAMHDLWQEDLIGTLRPASKAVLHLRCGELLAIESAESKSASMVSEAARHLIEAGVKDRAIKLLEDAATHQLANGLSEDAVASCDQALTIVSSDEDRIRLEDTRIAALLTIGGWTQIAAGVDRVIALRNNSEPAQIEHTPLELIAVESTMLAKMELSETIVRATACVRSRSADLLHRATAARLGARASSNLTHEERLRFFAEQAATMDRERPEILAEILAVETVFHTDLGSLARGAKNAEELVATERRTGSIRGLARALRYLTLPLRLAANFRDATEAATESFELAVRHRIAEDAAAAADSQASTQFDSGDLTGASTWLDRAEPWVRRVSARYARTSANITRAMIAIESGQAQEAELYLSTDIHSASADPIIRLRMFHLSILARIAVARQDHSMARACMTPLRDALTHARTFRRNQYFVASLAIATALTESPATGATVIDDFFDRSRDPGVPEWREFAALRHA